MLTLGIDIGSTASKAVIMRDGTELIAESIVPVGTGTRGPREVFQNVLDHAGNPKIKSTVSWLQDMAVWDLNRQHVTSVRSAAMQEAFIILFQQQAQLSISAVRMPKRFVWMPMAV